MTYGPFRILTVALIATRIALAHGTPGIALFFNSQVPVVARVGEPYEFQFSASTFAPEDASYIYSLSDQPAWLVLDSDTRTFSGAPSSADVGASSFTLTAADNTGAAHMPCVLVVSSDPPPRIEWSVTQQLAATANLSSSDPPVVTILPLEAFHFDFRQDSFIDIVQRKLSYYATLTDHTPLPAWLTFDDEALSFFGASPQLSAFPQSWDVELIASDVEGFAGAAASFTIAIGVQQLIFEPEIRKVNMTAGMELQYRGLVDTLFKSGEAVDPGTLQSAEATTPSWLAFDPKTLDMSGLVPADAVDQNVTITVADKDGNRATAIIGLVTGNASLFAAQTPILTARCGQYFSYQFPASLFTSQVSGLMVTLPVTASWLHFDSTNRTLSGTVPSDPGQATVEGTITARSSDAVPGESQELTIRLEASSSTVSSSTRTGTHARATSTASLEPLATVAGADDHHLSTGAVIGIIVGTIVAIAIVAALTVLWWRRRRRNEGYVEAVTPEKRTISRPILPPDAGIIAVTTDTHTDIEKRAGMRQPLAHNDLGPPPQIALDLPTQPGKNRMKWSKRFSRISLASSIGNGEEAIRADANIPTLGAQSVALHTPHDSFSVPNEIARSSRQMSDLSPTKAALRRLREKRESRHSVGLGIDTGGALLPRHSSKGAKVRRRTTSSIGQSTMQDRSSILSETTRGTSVLSTQPSDFPRPPTRSTVAGSRSTMTWGPSEAGKRKSIRLVARSDSTLDKRSLQDKRQSFIRNRASTSLASPLFAHGSLVPKDQRQNGGSSTNGSVTGRNRRSKRGVSQLTSFSESSSVEPPPRDPRRLSARVRSAFAPSFPRAVTKSTLDADERCGSDDADSAYDSTSESITESDLAAEMALPRHKRGWVLPGEASPTPPPAPPTSRHASSTRGTTASSGGTAPRQKWKERLRERSSSPLATAAPKHVAETASMSDASGAKRRSRLSEPMSLVSNDSLSKPKLERPRLVQTNSKRPVSVESIQRWSSLKAETEDVRPGSEMWEAMQGAGLMPPAVVEGRDGTQRSDRSGPAFL